MGSNIHADRTQENKSHTANDTDKRKSDSRSAVQLQDNTPQTSAQTELPAIANNSGEAQQLKAFADMANNSADVQQLKAFGDIVNNSAGVQQLKAFGDIANNSHHVQQLKAYKQMANNNTGAVQRKENPEEEPLQGKFEPVQKKENQTGLPDTLKSGIEHLSGMDISDVKVHYNSDKPAQLQAHAYAQGTDIHVAPGQEKHLPHEAWHVVQQKQGRVKPTLQMKAGTTINDDTGLENEADVMGAKANGLGQIDDGTQGQVQRKSQATGSSVVQMASLPEKFRAGGLKMAIAGETHGAIDKTIEKATWKEEKINLEYEAAKFEIKGNGEAKETKTMTPDPRIARLLFVISMMVETLDDLTKQEYKGNILTIPRKAKLSEALSYPFAQASNVFKSAKADVESKDPLLNGVPPETVNKSLAALAKWGAAYNRAKDDKERKVRESDVYESLGEFVDLQELLEKQLGNTPAAGRYTSADYSFYRSKKMYDTIVEIAASVGNTIYKVGNNHIKEMEEAELPPTAEVALLNQTQYMVELGALMDIHEKEKRGHYKE